MVAHRRTSRAGLTDLDLLSLRPMLAQTRKAAFDSEDHIFELKWDGVRYLVYRIGTEMRLLTRNGNDGTRRYPELSALRRLPPGTVIDGEVVSLVKGVPSFQRLQKREQMDRSARIEQASRKEPVAFVAFDLLAHRGVSVMRQPLMQRKKLLHDLLAKLHGKHLVESPFVATQGRGMFDEAVKLGFEGVIAKVRHSLYQPGKRSEDWLKIKPFQTREFEVIGFIADEGDRRINALILGEREDDQLVLRGKVGTGFSESDRREFFDRLSKFPRLRTPPAGSLRAQNPPQWKNTNLRALVRYYEITNDGRLRAPAFKGFV